MTEDDDIEQTEDSTTSFELSRVAAHTYSTETADETEGPGTEPGDTADEVDPRRLMGDPSVNELRWLYRTSLGKTLVDKPIDDAFKNGYEIENVEVDRDLQTILDETGWEDQYKMAKKKARRDGFALTYFVLEDDTDAVGEDPVDADVEGVKKLETITLDDMARYRTSHGTIAAGDDNDPLDDIGYDNYEIRPTGIVMDVDPMSETYKEPLGYLIGPPEWVKKSTRRHKVKFYHRNRFVHHVENPEVDADLETPTLGRYEGDSVLVAPYHLLRGMKRGNWSIMQTIFRYAAKMYHVELPEDADEDDWKEADKQMRNLNTKSELVTPHGYEIDDFATDGQLQPREYFDVVFDQICATSEMTKSVLFGTQAGTVTGSETDIKNYFNKVERMRQNDMVEDMQDYFARYVSLIDGRATEDYEVEFDVEWGPLFRLSELDNAERLTRIMQTVSAAVDTFVLTPKEARSILQEEWSEADIEWQSDFTEEENEWLRTLNIAQMGTEAALPEDQQPDEEGEGSGVEEGSPRQQNGGGMEQGQQTASEQPNLDTGLSSRDIDRIAEAVEERMQ